MKLSVFKRASNGMKVAIPILKSKIYNLKSTPNPKGFTLVEMLIIAPIVILVIGIFVSAIVTMTGEVLSVRATNTLTYNVQNALDTIDADVKSSAGYLATNNITLSNGQGYDNGTSVFKNANATTGNMLILNSYATTANPISSAQSYVYLTGQPNACTSSLVSQNDKLMTNIVYFVKDDNADGIYSLWRRVIMPSTYTACSTAWQKPTCVTDYVPATYPLCKANDTKLVDGVSTSGFSVNYFIAGADTAAGVNPTIKDSAQSDAIRQAAMLTTNTVEVTIDAAKTIAGRDITQSGKVKSVSANNNVTSNIVTSGLILNLDAGNSTSYPGSGTTWFDRSGSGNNGMLINGPTFSATNGGALNFNGSNYVQNSGIGFLPSGNSARTIMFWYKPNAGMSSTNIAFSYGDGGQGQYVGAWTAGGIIGLHLETCQVNGPVIPSPTTDWHFYTAVFNGGGNTITFYSDGSNAATVTAPCTINSTVGTGYAIGAGRWGNYIGSISNVNVYNRALTASEVTQNFNALKSRYGL